MPKNREQRRQPAQSITVDSLAGYPAAAEYLDISERQLRDLVYRRKVPYLKVGRLVRFRRAELDAWLEATRPVRVEDVVA